MVSTANSGISPTTDRSRSGIVRPSGVRVPSGIVQLATHS
jgi:hypothetical protein